MKLRTIDHLREGTPTQRAAWRALTDLGILDILAPFDARLAGTIPIDVDIPGSDLDILCHAPDLNALAQTLETHFGHAPGFTLARKTRYGHPVLVCEFAFGRFPIQVYGSPTPVGRQRAWVHMAAEAHLLALGGKEAKEAVRALKLAGEKTEPAFAQVFGLTGDPYEVLYDLGMRVLGGDKDKHLRYPAKRSVTKARRNEDTKKTCYFLLRAFVSSYLRGLL